MLVNKLGITELAALQAREEEALVAAYEILFGEVTKKTPLTCDLLRHIHATIFDNLYGWAGRWRTVWIQKPGVTWPPPDFLDQAMTEYEAQVLTAYPASSVADEKGFVQALAEIQGEFLVIHPFREGNARTIKLACDLLAAQTDRPILRYEESDAGQAAYIEAAKAAFKRNYDPLARLIAEALERGRQAPPTA
ncbi:MAG: Fic/DOC family protein [Pirellulales bacterium]